MQYQEIFLGVTPKPHRDYLQGAFSRLKGRYNRLIIPCVGRFSAAELAMSVGWRAEDIITSDISLFTTVVGRHINGEELDSLGVVYAGDTLLKLTCDGAPLSPTDPAHILYAMKVCQTKGTNYYENLLRRELIRDSKGYVEQIRRALDKFARSLRGVTYRVRDMWEEIEEYRNDPTAAFWINPPGYTLGYTKMYNTQGQISWAEPKVPEFDPKTDHRKLYELLLDCPACVLMYRYQAIEDDLKDFAVFGHIFFKGRTDYILCNKPEETFVTASVKPSTKVAPSKWHQLPETHEITYDSKIDFAPSSKEAVLYYRDLWAHKLGATKSQFYYLMLIDGYVMGCFGIWLRNALTGSHPWVNETFGFNVPHKKYPRLNKLLMMCLCSCDFEQVCRRDVNLEFVKLEGLQTTCITTHPDLKIYRGILALTERETMPNGSYKLNYYARWKPFGFAESLRLWLDKEVYQNQEGQERWQREYARLAKT